MKVLRGSLTFILGLVVGILIIVIAIGSTLAIMGTLVTVGDLQDKFLQNEFISSDSELYSQTILQAVKGLIQDWQGFDGLSLQMLYEKYGLNILKEIGGIDLSQKAFFSATIKEIMDDLSIVTNSFTLEDISKVAGIDFASYNLPILTDNLQNNISTALGNILGLLNGDLTVRTIKDNLGIDIGTGDSALIATLQDVSLSQFGNVLNVLVLNKILDGDTDTFMLIGDTNKYVTAEDDTFAEVSAADLQNSSYVAPIGVETYLAGGKDTNGDDKADKMDIRELRYVKKSTVVEGETIEKYVVDNSCYAEGFNAEESGKTFYRHILYNLCTPGATYPAGTEFYYECFANRIDTTDGTDYTLYSKGLIAESSFDTGYDTPDNVWIMPAGTLDKDSKLVLDAVTPATTKYVRVHEGSDPTLLQSFNYMTISDLQDAGSILNGLTIGDVVTITDSSPAILKSLRNSTLNTIGDDIRTLTIDNVIDIDDSSSPIMKSLKKRGCTIDDLSTIADELALCEILDINYDVYVEDATGDFVFMPIYVKYNEYIHDDSEQRYDYTGTSYIPAVTGQYVKTGYYTLYDAALHTGMTRYDLQTEGDSIAIQSLGRRGCKVQDLGTIMDELYLPEILRIDRLSALIFKSLAKKGCKLGEFDTIIDTLEIGEMIVIDSTSAVIMQSLAARHCTLQNMANVVDELTLSELISITSDTFTANANGKYVLVEDTHSYVLYDSSDPTMAGMQRYRKDGGLYVADSNGDFVHAKYYTLYNPAVHTSATRYARTSAPGASSALLQRFASATLGSFSTAFDELMLADVMAIDADVYAAVNAAYITANPDERYFYYDSTNSVYRVANEQYRLANPSTTYYRIAQSGSDAAFLKKVAYVKVDGMADAFTVVVDDMMLSEFIDIYTESAITISAPSHSADGKYFIEYNSADAIFSGNNAELGDYITIYDAQGELALTNYKANQVSSPTSTTVYYEYKPYTTLGANAAAILTNPTTATNMAEANVFYKRGGNYVRNVPVGTYLITKDASKVYYRVVKAGATAPDVANGVYGGNIYSSAGTYYVRDDFQGYINATGSSSPSYADMPIYTMQHSATDICEFMVDAEDVSFLASANGASFNSTGLRYSRRSVETIYVSTLLTTGVYVYENGTYVVYDSANPAHASLPRFEKKKGYIASDGEAYYEESSIYKTEFNLKNVTFVREKSSPVLRLLASGTIGEMSNVINTAKVSDIIEASPGSIFDNPAIKDSTISNMGNAFVDVFSNMTIGQLIDWAKVDGVDGNVKHALSDATLSDFLKSLEYSAATGTISVNMAKLYGAE